MPQLLYQVERRRRTPFRILKHLGEFDNRQI
jgi:hypothetical protein